MHKREARPAMAYLFPQLPGPKPALPYIDVVQEDDTTFTNLGEPALEIVADGLVGMVAVDVEQIDTGVTKVSESFVKSAMHELRERAVQWVMVCSQCREHFWPIKPGLRITLPGIDRVTSGPYAELV